MSVLREHLTAVAALRRALADAKAEEAARQAALQESAAYQAYATAQEGRRDVERAVGDAERALREAALAAFRETGDTKPAMGVSVRMYKVYKYDPEAARDWCMMNAPAFLVVDGKRFERAVEQMPGAPVAIELDPRPAIASDLSGYL